MRGCSKLYIQSYLDEFMWRWNSNYSRSDVYNNIFSVVNDVYDIGELTSDEEIEPITIEPESVELKNQILYELNNLIITHFAEQQNE
ncbi:unnamed protein product [Brachionus calyciflorus]|uniref:Uncharacterized protein n=1 Tax=Brachionus calyciflorus TaxID=104777 RepID=A0A814I9G7_9BILA|nr:unnamed protein product [Brachionus calyciflorus]